jgi:hypothetical protein
MTISGQLFARHGNYLEKHEVQWTDHLLLNFWTAVSTARAPDT